VLGNLEFNSIGWATAEKRPEPRPPPGTQRSA
jgi:hypothetical protein